MLLGVSLILKIILKIRLKWKRGHSFNISHSPIPGIGKQKMTSPARFLSVDGVVAPLPDTPPVTTLLASYPGAYTTTRTHNNGSVLLFWKRHLRRLADSARILVNSDPKLLFKPGNTPVPDIMNLNQFSKWDSVVESLVDDSMGKALPFVLKEKKVGEELAVTALLSGNWDILCGDETVSEEKILRCFSVYVHVGVYAPLLFGVRENGAHLAVVGRGRDVGNAKYSDWVRLRKKLEKLRPPSATELLLSSDGDHILEGSLTNFFVVCRKDSNVKVVSTGSVEEDLRNCESAYPVEIQTTPISDGVLPGVVRQVIIEVCSRLGIPLREVAPSWSEHDLWQEAFITNSLRLLQHVKTIQVPSSWDVKEFGTWKDVAWEEKHFEEDPGSITALIQKEIMEKEALEGYPVSFG